MTPPPKAGGSFTVVTPPLSDSYTPVQIPFPRNRIQIATDIGQGGRLPAPIRGQLDSGIKRKDNPFRIQ